MGQYRHGGDIYSYPGCVDFSASCSPLGTPPAVRRAVLDAADQIFAYPQPGSAELEKAVAAYEGVEYEQVICTNGAAECIYLLCQALRPGRAIVTAPSFSEYEQALAGVGCSTIVWNRSEESGFTLEESFLEYLTEDIGMVFLCNPNNPEGRLAAPGLMETILHRCRDRGILLVVDECFMDFVQEPEKYSLVRLLGQEKQLFIVKAFTKRYGMAGLRLGYGMGDAGLISALRSCVQPWNVSSLAQAAGQAALGEEVFVEEARRLVAVQRPVLEKGIQNLGWKVYPSDANFLLFKGPEGLFEGCARRGFLIRDCSNFPGLGEGFYRIAVKKEAENRALLAAFGEIAGQAFERTASD